jgi:hypothetical protein
MMFMACASWLLLPAARRTVARVGAIQLAKNIELVILNKTGSIIYRSLSPGFSFACPLVPIPEQQLALQKLEDDTHSSRSRPPQTRPAPTSRTLQCRSNLKVDRLTDELKLASAPYVGHVPPYMRVHKSYFESFFAILSN